MSPGSGFAEAFDFYGTGFVGEAPVQGPEFASSMDPSTEASALGGFLFRLHSEPSSWLALLHPRGLEESLYAELGNLLASREADRLSALAGMPVAISPPEPLSTPAIARLQAIATQRLRLEHRTGGHVVPLLLLRIQDSREEAGNG